MKAKCHEPDHGAPRASKYAYEALAEDFFYLLDRKELLNLTLGRGDERSSSNRCRDQMIGKRRYASERAASRRLLPESIARTQPPGKEWVIERVGKSECAFRLFPIKRIVPNPQLAVFNVPDVTPEIVSASALSDEELLLAKVRYSRLLDIFLGVTAYSLQNHLCTTVSGIGQVEVDEIYVAIDKSGRQCALPVQAKGGSDRLCMEQTRQDMACCVERFPQLRCRAISAQFFEDDSIALFELIQSDGEIRITEERHYRLVPAGEISRDDLRKYGS